MMQRVLSMNTVHRTCKIASSFVRLFVIFAIHSTTKTLDRALFFERISLVIYISYYTRPIGLHQIEVKLCSQATRSYSDSPEATAAMLAGLLYIHPLPRTVLQAICSLP